MATKKTVTDEPEVIESIVPEDPWKRTKEIYIPRGASQETSTWVCVNGRTWQVPTGKRVEVPEPVAEVIENSLAMQERSQGIKDRLEQQANGR